LTALGRVGPEQGTASENVTDRRTGFPVDEALISAWTDAVARLREDADASLPDAGITIDPRLATAGPLYR